MFFHPNTECAVSFQHTAYLPRGAAYSPTTLRRDAVKQTPFKLQTPAAYLIFTFLKFFLVSFCFIQTLDILKDYLTAIQLPLPVTKAHFPASVAALPDLSCSLLF
jgi:hypothetical protein